MHNRFHHTARPCIFMRFTSLILILILAFTLGACQPKPAPPATLPPYPLANFAWVFNEQDLTLTDPQGIAVYILTADGTAWQPIVSPGLQGLLPPGIQVTHNDAGDWIIVDPDGKTYQVWDTATLRWRSETSLTETMQAAELAAAALTQTIAALTPTEQILPSATPQPTEAEPTMAPPVSSTVSTLSANCQPAVPSRLTAGGTARVILNLNLRRSPEISNNITDSYQVGEIINLVAGPTCIPVENSAYLWWQVSGTDGSSGWVVEATLTGTGYFLEPVP